MSRQMLAIIALFAFVSGVWGQSLLDNSYYKRSQELRALAQGAYDDGDYDASADYAAQAQEYARLSDQYVEKMVALDKADRAMASASERLSWAEEHGVTIRFPDQFATAQTEMQLSKDSYAAESYDEATSHAEAVLAALKEATAERPLPAVYIVRLLPGRSDCLWRIAGYPFVYNNPLKWSVIYEANRKNFRDPSNPNLIFPGQKLIIPSLVGERRQGTFDPNAIYEPLPKK